jgi:hypothetical protein
MATTAFDRLGEMRQQRRLATAVRADDGRRATEIPEPFKQPFDIDRQARFIERLDPSRPSESR